MLFMFIIVNRQIQLIYLPKPDYRKSLYIQMNLYKDFQ
jgi:hypothetical protein